MKIPENFKYTIVINQKALVGIAPNITFEEAAILYYIQKMCEDPHEAIERHRVDGYTWITYGKIINDMPLLRAKSAASLVEKIKKLEKYGLVQTMTKTCQGGQKKYFMMPEKLSYLINKNGDGELYIMLLSIGMNEGQAAEIASNHAFLQDKKQPIKRAINKKIDEPAAFIWHVYQVYIGKEFNI
jgi:hypothetical protein